MQLSDGVFHMPALFLEHYNYNSADSGWCRLWFQDRRLNLRHSVKNSIWSKTSWLSRFRLTVMYYFYFLFTFVSLFEVMRKTHFVFYKNYHCEPHNAYRIFHSRKHTKQRYSFNFNHILAFLCQASRATLVAINIFLYPVFIILCSHPTTEPPHQGCQAIHSHSCDRYLGAVLDGCSYLILQQHKVKRLPTAFLIKTLTRMKVTLKSLYRSWLKQMMRESQMLSCLPVRLDKTSLEVDQA